MRTSKSKSGLLSDELTLKTSGISWHSGYLIRKAIPGHTKSSCPSRTSEYKPKLVLVKTPQNTILAFKNVQLATHEPEVVSYFLALHRFFPA